MKKNNELNMKGGAGRVVPLYKEPKNSPFIPNTQKQIYGERIAENAPRQYIQPGEQAQTGQTGQQYVTPTVTNQPYSTNQPQNKLNPIVNLQVYQPPPKPRETNPMGTFNPAIVPGPYFPPQYNYQIPPYMVQTATGYSMPQQIIRSYNINIDGVTGDHTKLNLIYEDILPSRQFSGTAATISERLNVYNFIRAMIFEQGDGKNVGLDGKSCDSLLSHLKFMDLNPYNTYKLSNNPYKGLPVGFLIYRSCYPIRHDAAESTVVCARNSVGTNIRIYKMTEGSYLINQNATKLTEYPEWREMTYYEFVREQIIKKKECPNFVLLYGYYISENSRIDFDKIASMRGIDVKPEPKYITTATVTNQPGSIIQTEIVPASGYANYYANNYGALNQNLNGNYAIPNLPKAIAMPCAPGQVNQKFLQTGGSLTLNINPNAYTGKALVAITEAPNYNLFGWASRTYQVDGNIKRQINTGFHLDKVWYSVIFQIIIAMYCLQIHKIFFNEFTAEDNIYIKDISSHGPATRYWKYKIDGIDYFIPNYGYVVMIDSNYKDLPAVDCNNLLNKPELFKPYKIYAKFMDENIPDQEFDNKTFEAFTRAVDSNIYDQTFVDNGGCKPPPEVLFLLNQIKTYTCSDTDKQISKYPYMFMRRFMNNRIGSYLKETEVQNIRRDEQKDFVRGQLIVYEDGSSSYKFVMFINLANVGVATILSKNDPTNEDIIEMQVPVTSLYGYSKMDPIVQNFKPNESLLNEEDLLETYVLNKL